MRGRQSPALRNTSPYRQSSTSSCPHLPAAQFPETLRDFLHTRRHTALHGGHHQVEGVETFAMAKWICHGTTATEERQQAGDKNRRTEHDVIPRSGFNRSGDVLVKAIAANSDEQFGMLSDRSMIMLEKPLQGTNA